MQAVSLDPQYLAVASHTDRFYGGQRSARSPERYYPEREEEPPPLVVPPSYPLRRPGPITHQYWITTDDDPIVTEALTTYGEFEGHVRAIQQQLGTILSHVRPLGVPSLHLPLSILRENLQYISFHFHRNASQLLQRPLPYEVEVRAGMVPTSLEDALDAVAFQLNKIDLELNEHLRELGNDDLTVAIDELSRVLGSRSKSLRAHKALSGTPALASYLHSVSIDLMQYLIPLKQGLTRSTKVGLAAAQYIREFRDNYEAVLSTAATFLSGVTATVVQYSLNNRAQPIDDVVNGLFFSSLVLSLCAAVTSALGLGLRWILFKSEADKAPDWADFWTKKGSVWLMVMAVMLLDTGLVGFCFSTQSDAVKYVTLCVSLISNLGVIAVCAWIAKVHFSRGPRYNHRRPDSLVPRVQPWRVLRIYVPVFPPTRRPAVPSIAESNIFLQIRQSEPRYAGSVRGAVRYMTFSPSGQMLAVTTQNSVTVYFTIAPVGGPSNSIEIDIRDVKHVSWSTSSRLLIRTTRVLWIWSAAAPKQPIDIIRRIQRIDAADWCALHGNEEIIFLEQGVIHTTRRCDAKGYKLEQLSRLSIALDHIKILDMAIGLDGAHIAAVGRLRSTLSQETKDRKQCSQFLSQNELELERRIVVCDLNDQVIRAEVPVLCDIRNVAISAVKEDRFTVLVGSERKSSPQEWEYRNTAVVETFRLVPNRVYAVDGDTESTGPACIARRADATFVLVPTRKGEIFIWSTGSERRPESIHMPPGDGFPTAVAWSERSPSLMLATGSNEGKVHYWAPKDPMAE